MNKIDSFLNERKKNIYSLGSEPKFKQIGLNFIIETAKNKYSYNFSWLGRPIIQYPQDIIAIQEIIWEVKPDLIIETGIAYGGSIIFYASMLELIGHGEVLGIDIDIRSHNRKAIENHPMYKRITMIEGSSVSQEVINQVNEFAKKKGKILVILDSNHTYQHVLEELRLYSPFVTIGSYLVVLDTVIEDMPENSFPNKPWGKGNNPKTAVWEFLKNKKDFVVEKNIENKLLITVAPDGYLKKIK